MRNIGVTSNPSFATIFPRATPGGTIMETTKPTKTISQLFEEFIADQKGRISPKLW
jgi:hypothetical protein